MQSWFGLNLAAISGTQFLRLLGVWFGTWLFWHVMCLLFHKLIELTMPEELHPKLHDQDERGLLVADPSMWVSYTKYGYLYIFLRPFVLTRKSKLALAAVTTWGIAKFCILC